MKHSLIFVLIASSLMFAACSKKEDTAKAADTAKVATTKASTSAAKKPEDKPREATYDANLKPAQIVWDSPEKQKAWEARQAELKQKAAQPQPKK